MVLSLVEFEQDLTNIEVVRRLKFMGVVADGVAAPPDGGSVALDPRSNMVLMVSLLDRLVASRVEAHLCFRSPNLAILPLHISSGELDGNLLWHLTQMLVKRLIFLTE
jgi:hypothetical protein